MDYKRSTDCKKLDPETMITTITDCHQRPCCLDQTRYMMSDRMAEYCICRNIFQIGCLNGCQIRCRIECLGKLSDGMSERILDKRPEYYVSWNVGVCVRICQIPQSISWWGHSKIRRYHLVALTSFNFLANFTNPLPIGCV